MAYELDPIQQKLYQMEQTNPSNPRKLTLRERIKSYFLRFRPMLHDVDYADRDGTTKAEKNFQACGTYDPHTASFIAYGNKAISLIGNIRSSSSQDNPDFIRRNALNALSINENAFCALMGYMGRGWEIPRELTFSYDISAIISLECLRFLSSKGELDSELNDQKEVFHRRLSSRYRKEPHYVVKSLH